MSEEKTPPTWKEAEGTDRKATAQRKGQNRDTPAAPGSWGEAEARDTEAREKAAQEGKK